MNRFVVYSILQILSPISFMFWFRLFKWQALQLGSLLYIVAACDQYDNIIDFSFVVITLWQNDGMQ